MTTRGEKLRSGIASRLESSRKQTQCLTGYEAASTAGYESALEGILDDMEDRT